MPPARFELVMARAGPLLCEDLGDMRLIRILAVLVVALACGVAKSQTPAVIYSWAGVPSTTQGWQVWGAHNFLPNYNPPFNRGTISGATGDLVVKETGTGAEAGGTVWIIDAFDKATETAPAKGQLDVTGLDYIEIDIQHNSPTATVNVDFLIQSLATETVSVYGGSDDTIVVQDVQHPLPTPPAWPVGPGKNTIRFPVSQLTPRQQTSIKTLWLTPEPHTAVGNLTWTISEVRTAGTPLTYRDVVTNDIGSPDDGLDGAFPLNTSDMLAIVGNPGVRNQVGFSRNPSGSGSLQWTDKGGDGEIGSESGASIGWGSGAGWRNAQPGLPTDGNSYNERISDFSNYDRMTVRISAKDVLAPTGTVGIEGLFAAKEPTELDPPTILPSLDLTTDGQYHDLVFDISSVDFRKNIWHWGLDVAPHPNNIVFNIDNIRMWNSSAPQGPLGDLNHDGAVDAADAGIMFGNWGSSGVGDLNTDGIVDAADAGELFAEWTGDVAPASVPEPASLTVIATAAVSLLVMRKRSRI